MLAMITAFDNDWAIGKDNQLLCHLPNDLKYFKKITENNFVVMGRKTFESIGKPLENRFNIVLTRDEEWRAEGVCPLNNVDEVLEFFINNCGFPESPKMFIIGGEQIYKTFIHYVDRLYITKIHNTFEGADSFFPPIPMREWEVTEVTPNRKSAKNKYDHDFIIMDRRIIDEA